ncbi:MAG: T9SS type A sorting domain-containing protein [Cyclobacteriaceae bacterium]
MPILLGILPDASAQGFESIAPLKPLAAAKTTGEKPQSKVWHYDGKWWAVFPITTGTYIWRLEGISWISTLKISSSTSVEADCKVLDNVCHIFLWRNGHNASQLISVEYNRNTDTYELWSQRTSTVMINLDSGAETGTIDIDGRGMMWLASDGVDDIRVRWSDSPYTTWSSPVIVATGITDDDICTVIALPVQGQMGVFWSNQNAKRFGFKTHNDGTSASSWSADEMPASQSALNIGKGLADDHLNLAIAGDGTLYCAVKTSYDTPGYPRLALLKRLPTGSWDNLYEVSQSGTRGIVILNEAAETLKIVYASQEQGGDILYRESSTSNISFGPALTLISGSYNNPTSIKNNYTSDIVILASDTAKIVSVLGSDYSALTVAISPRFPADEFVARLYPNPVDELISLQIHEETENGISISISDPLGRIYLRTSTDIRNHTIQLHLGDLHLPSGWHLLIIQSEKYTRAFRFIKK